MKTTWQLYSRMPEALWKRLRRLIPRRHRSPKGGRPPLDPRRVADGIYYILRTGCQWKAAPREYGSGSALHNYFQLWTRRGVFRKLWKEGLAAYDRRRRIRWTWQTLDTELHKAPLGGKKTGKNPTDRGKLGSKRSVLTDACGVVLGLVLGPANAHDVTLAKDTLASLPVRRPRPNKRHPQHLCADKAYDSADFRRTAKRRHYVPHIKPRGVEIEEHRLHPHAPARRWVNERTHSWFNRFRRILIRWEKKPENYLAELQFAAAWFAFRAAGVFG